jgi:hypothetical protein
MMPGFLNVKDIPYNCYSIVLQPYLPKGVFDWKDVYGTLIGGLISLGLLFVFYKLIKNGSVYYEF